MKRNLSILAAVLAIFLVTVWAQKYFRQSRINPIAQKPTESSVSQSSPTDAASAQNQENSSGQSTQNKNTPDGFQPPLSRAAERVTKKPFGIFITPQNSPVQPERFRGYHTGTDFEIFSDETSADVPVHAICPGTIAQKRTASGYGGVLVQNCTLDGQPITVVYGHLKLASIPKNSGNNLSSGETIGILGKGYSSETDGERKHLHLALHKGKSVSILGYVQSKSQLSDWIDACTLVCNK